MLKTHWMSQKFLETKTLWGRVQLDGPRMRLTKESCCILLLFPP